MCVDEYGDGAELADYAADGRRDLLAVSDVALVADAGWTGVGVLHVRCSRVAVLVDLGCGVGGALLSAAQ